MEQENALSRMSNDDTGSDTFKLSHREHYIIQRAEGNSTKQLAEDFHALASMSSSGITLVECVCKLDSELGRRMESRGQQVERWGLWNFDLSTTAGYQNARERLAQLRHLHFWAAPSLR